MSQKKILHIIQSLGNGGCENMLLRTLPLLDEFDHKIITLKELGELAPKFVSAGIAVETIHCDHIFDISGIKRLRKLVREEKADIIITYLFHADMLGRLALHRVTKSPILPFLRTTYNHPRYLAARILEWLTKPLVKQYLANSEAVKEFYTKHLGIAPEKITVIPNGIDTNYFDSVIPDPKLKELLGIGPDDFVIICVANLHINKGHRYLLEAFEQLHTPPYHPGLNPESNPKQNFKLLIVGDGNEKENLFHQIEGYRSQENILFLGRRADVPKLLKISNLFILPTLFEGQSNAIMEAMASGLPVITTDIPENRALIENDISGILVPTHQTKEISEAILAIRDDVSLEQELGKIAKYFLKENYSLEKTTYKLSNFLKKMA